MPLSQINPPRNHREFHNSRKLLERTVNLATAASQLGEAGRHITDITCTAETSQNAPGPAIPSARERHLHTAKVGARPAEGGAGGGGRHLRRRPHRRLEARGDALLVRADRLAGEAVRLRLSTTAVATFSATSRMRPGCGTTDSTLMSCASSELATASAATMKNDSGIVLASHFIAPNDIPGKMKKLFTWPGSRVGR